MAWGRVALAFWVGGLMAASVQGAASLPPNPQRPMNAKTCEEAMARLREAQRGSPLISPEENREVLAQAEAIAARLCGHRPGAGAGKD